MNLPTHEECLAYLNKYHTPPNVIKHSLVVTKVADYLAEKFNQAGIKVDANLINRACLLHDIVRLTDKGHHAEVGADIFRKKYPEIANLIAKHRLSAILKDDLHAWEERIVYYADKRVNHDQLVNIEARMQEGRKRWNVKRSEDQHKLILRKMKELEKNIFTIIKQSPESINDL